MSDLIIKTTLMQLMETHNRPDLLKRMNINDPRNIHGEKWFIRIGASWCHRFYKRHNFKSRVATEAAVVPESSDSESSSDDKEPVVVPAKRKRKPNVMIGSVANGKYRSI